jgi:hypothetical protein
MLSMLIASQNYKKVNDPGEQPKNITGCSAA